MLEEKIFEDAFILHERSAFAWSVEKYFGKTTKESLEYLAKHHDFLSYLPISNEIKDLPNDTRKELHIKWANYKNIFKYQPLDLIRDYFGELFAFYFAWVGYLTFFLIVPTVIGLIFFFIGLGWA